MAGRLAGKTALITAAGQGIGHATAVAFQKEGARLWATDIDEARLAGLATLEGVSCRALDVRDGDAVAAAAAEIGALDVLFNCAGRVPHGAILDCEAQDWAETLDLNVTATYRMIRAFLPAMLAQGAGSIINMASVVSTVKAAPERCAYHASKAAVIGLTKSVAFDYAARGIRCNAICPGAIDTPSFDERMNAHPEPAAVRAAFIARHPVGRIGSPTEVAALSVYLASDESAFTTGQALVIDGAWSL
ncbi:MAG: SDR family oxidoreductase [Rhodospirillales bacterium]|nr:SDR family oxidoreductase [Rhodospirillales bacterium]MDE0378019.1 SDR family oxidoreductase [Rhodospirillales bacterium]